MESSNNYIMENTVNNNGNMGINLSPNSSYNEIVDNIVNFNGFGIHFNDNSANNLILDNNCSHNIYGIIVRTPNNTISGNYVEYNSVVGMHFWSADAYNNTQNNNITRNFIYNNNYGIKFTIEVGGFFGSESALNMFEGNRISDNTRGFEIDAGCNDNLIFNNTFSDNSDANAVDNGNNNNWNSSTLGNYWDDYTGKDTKDDGVGDTPYSISGAAGSQDNYPIWWDAPVISVNSPSQNDYFSINSPNFDISIEEGVVNLTWYTLDGGIVNKTFTGLTSTIDQALWNSISDGSVTIRFYANDTMNNIAFKEITINKDTTAPIITINSPSTDEIFGNNAPGYNLTIIEPDIHTMWYTLDSGTTNFTFTGLTGTIDQTIWDSISEGDVMIRFYVNDSAGNINFEEIQVIKRIPEATGIPGYNLFFLLGTISVVAIVISTKLKKFNK